MRYIKISVILGTPSKSKKSILYDKTFMIDIVDKVSCSKVEKLINVYGGVSVLIYYINIIDIVLKIIISIDLFIIFISTVL